MGCSRAALESDTVAIIGPTGQQIRRERQRRGLTQQQLATNAGVSLRTISRIERDELDPSSLELVAAELGLQVGTDDDPNAKLLRDASNDGVMSTTGNTLTVVDRHVGYTNEGYRIDLVARDDTGHKVRVHVLHSITASKSYAVAEVLAADLTWTNLATESPSNWHDDIPDHDWEGGYDRAIHQQSLSPEQHEGGPAMVAALQKVADALLDRAAAILA
jgi:transcriptional regulator with XRE-family HTH domain